jgi:hypothetical protein
MTTIPDSIGAILKYQDDIQRLAGSGALRLLEDSRKALEEA